MLASVQPRPAHLAEVAVSLLARFSGQARLSLGQLPSDPGRREVPISSEGGEPEPRELQLPTYFDKAGPFVVDALNALELDAMPTWSGLHHLYRRHRDESSMGRVCLILCNCM